MSRKASNFQKVVMSHIYRGKEIFKPLNTGHTGWTDNLDWAFAHRDEVCNSLRRKPKVQSPRPAGTVRWLQGG